MKKVSLKTIFEEKRKEPKFSNLLTRKDIRKELEKVKTVYLIQHPYNYEYQLLIHEFVINSKGRKYVPGELEALSKKVINAIDGYDMFGCNRSVGKVNHKHIAGLVTNLKTNSVYELKEKIRRIYDFCPNLKNIIMEDEIELKGE